MTTPTFRQRLVELIAMHPPRTSNHAQTVREHAKAMLEELNHADHALNDGRTGGYYTDTTGARYRLIADPVRPDPPEDAHVYWRRAET